MVGAIGEEVKRAAAAQVEPGVMPVAGHNAVLDRAAVQRETEMRATIVEREYLTFVPAKQHRTIRSVHCHHLLFFQVGERCGAKESSKIRRNAKGGHSQQDNRFIVQR